LAPTVFNRGAALTFSQPRCADADDNGRSWKLKSRSDEPMKVLVTGGTGFTGSHLVRRLIEDGHEVYSIDYAKGLFYDELQELGAKIELGSIVE
jgi:glutamate dehydrogenase/leucine dehydrogenase